MSEIISAGAELQRILISLSNKHQAENCRCTWSYNTLGNKGTGPWTCQTNLRDGPSHRLGTLWSCWTGTRTGLGFECSHTLWHSLCQDELFTQLDVCAALGCHSARKSPRVRSNHVQGLEGTEGQEMEMKMDAMSLRNRGWMGKKWRE